MHTGRDRHAPKRPCKARQLQLERQEEKRRRNAEAKSDAAEARALAHATKKSKKPSTRAVREEALRKRAME